MGIPREPSNKNEGLRRDYTRTPHITKSYLLGILHDGTKRKTTYRIAQKGLAFVKMLESGIKRLGGRSWSYQEGKQRDVYITEFSKSFLRNVAITTDQDKLAYVRGYFDAEGGIAKTPNVRFYIYFAQKNFDDLNNVLLQLWDHHIRTNHNTLSYIRDEDIVHTPRKSGKYMNKVSVLEGADGSPPF